MSVIVLSLDDRRAGAAEDRRGVSVQLHLVDEDIDPGHDETLQRRTVAVRALGKELESELEAVGDDALLFADAYGDARHGSPARHVDRDRHDAFGETEFVHQDTLAVGTSRARSCSTVATASGTASATGPLSPMQPS